MDLNFRRLLETLAAIPGSRKASTSEILGRLKTRGYSVTPRTLQRDLDALAREFGVECDDRSKPYGWHWPKRRPRFSLPEMDWPEALSLYLLREYLNGLLPSSVQEHLEPYFAEAERKLKQKFPDAPLRRWPEKVRVSPPGQRLQSPKVSRAVRDTVTEALLAEHQVEIHYRRPGAKDVQKSRVHPLGLIQHGRVFYLAVRFFDYEDVRMIALHRIERASGLAERIQKPAGFSLDTWLDEGAMGFGGTGTIRLVAEFRSGAGRHLLESPLSDDQTVVTLDDGKSLRVTASVRNTEQLRWWLMGFGSNAEVIAPPTLRADIAARLRKAAERYAGRKP